ncbi:MAG: S-adenosylmethionine:tRNA ribosyltransferase-isomerase [Bacteroidota bacterium]
MHPGELSIKDFTYDLPSEKIALFPAEQRDGSKLLIYKPGNIRGNIFKNIADFIPEGSLLIFNNTSVVPARLHFENKEGKKIEIFCLGPADKFQHDLEEAFHQKNKVQWKCLVGGAKKWKEGKLVKTIIQNDREISLTAEKKMYCGDHVIIEFSWGKNEFTFDNILQYFGEIPLPPYIKRALKNSDAQRYQTTYAALKGSVAAPTAGLHFTEDVFNALHKKNIHTSFLTLHVGAGTFMPVKSDVMDGHDMHSEVFEIKISVLDKIIQQEGHIIAVGTTSLRVLESLYWMGNKILANPAIKMEHLSIGQWEPYEAQHTIISTSTSLQALKKWMQENKKETLNCSTKILIAPGYDFHIVNALITNFHQPGSTLLLLVAAFIGEKWTTVYDFALENNFRFLSYGDSCLLCRE